MSSPSTATVITATGIIYQVATLDQRILRLRATIDKNILKLRAMSKRHAEHTEQPLRRLVALAEESLALHMVLLAKTGRTAVGSEEPFHLTSSEEDDDDDDA